MIQLWSFELLCSSTSDYNLWGFFSDYFHSLTYQRSLDVRSQWRWSRCQGCAVQVQEMWCSRSQWSPSLPPPCISLWCLWSSGTSPSRFWLMLHTTSMIRSRKSSKWWYCHVWKLSTQSPKSDKQRSDKEFIFRTPLMVPLISVYRERVS